MRKSKLSSTSLQQKEIIKFLDATLDGNTSMVQTLLDQGVFVDSMDLGRNSALMIATHEAHIPVIQLLLERNATVDHQNEDGYSALHIAAMYGHSEVIPVLLEHHASIDIQDFVGGTALMWSFVTGQGGCASVLLENGADLFMTNTVGKTAKDIAQNSGSWEIRKIVNDFECKKQGVISTIPHHQPQRKQPMKEPVATFTCEPIDKTLTEENKSLAIEAESWKDENQRLTWQLLVIRAGLCFHEPPERKKQESNITSQSLEEENRLLKMEIKSLNEDNERLTLQLLVKRAGF